MSLQYHAAFEALRMGRGSAYGVRILMQAIVLTGFIDDARRSEIRADALVLAERGLCDAIKRGESDDCWMLDSADATAVIAALLAWHDDQLRTAPLAVLEEAIERLERLRVGKSFERPSVRVT